MKNNIPFEANGVISSGSSHLGRASFGPAGGQPFEKVAKHIKNKGSINTI
jgi:hypothetical protein